MIVGNGLTPHVAYLDGASYNDALWSAHLQGYNNAEEEINARMKAERLEARRVIASGPFADVHRRAHRLEGARRLKDAGRRATEPEPGQEQEQEQEQEQGLKLEAKVSSSHSL